MKQAKIEFQYNACSATGHYSVIIDCIVNGSNSFSTLITVDVIPKCIKFAHEQLIFQPSQCLRKYVNIYNPVNVPVEFQWHVPQSCYRIQPASAIIPVHRNITCCVKYIPVPNAPTSIDATLSCGSRRPHIVSISLISDPPRIKLKNAKIEFNRAPLNLPMKGHTALQNLGNEPVTYQVLNPNPIPGVKVAPTSGTICGFAEEVFAIDLKICACVVFSCRVQIELQGTKLIEFEICGSVIYPDVQVKPDFIKLQKILANAFARHIFMLINNSLLPVVIDFALKDFPEYKIYGSSAIERNSVPIKRIEMEPEERRELCLHFHPIGAATYRFCLPIIINNILGPAEQGKSDSMNTDFYLDKYKEEYLNACEAEPVKIPPKIPVLVVNSSVGGDILRFSKLSLSFKYFPSPTFRSVTSTDLRIWNASKDTCKFCIRTDDLQRPFAMRYARGNEVETFDYSIVCVLAPAEEVVLSVSFCPILAGNYYAKLPIYLRHYLDGTVFNYLYLQGWYPEPIIRPLETDIYFEPMPLRFESEYSFSTVTEFHSKYCELNARTEHANVRVILTEKETGAEQRTIRTIVKFCCMKPMTIDCLVFIFCTCGATATVAIFGCSDNCLATTHAFVGNYAKTLFSKLPYTTSQSSFKVQ